MASKPSGVKSPGRKGKKSYDSFGTFIHKVLKQVHPDTGMSGDAKMTVDRMIHIIFHKLNCNLKSIMESVGSKTLTSRHIQTAVRMTLPGELAKHAVTEGTKAISKYNNKVSSENPGTKANPNKAVSQSTKAGLQFSVARARHLLGTCYRIGKGAPVYLAAVLEYLVAEIMELAGNNARDAKVVRITTQHIFGAIHHDEELQQLFQSVYILGGGYNMSVKSRLEESVDRARKAIEHKKGKKTGMGVINKRASRGRKLLRQSGKGNLRFPAVPFSRLATEVQQDFADNIKITKDARRALQHFIEHHAIDQLKMAGAIANNSGREAVQPKDLQLARLSMGLRF